MVANKDLKCFINTAKNGAKYRACLPKKNTPYKKHQDLRGKPHSDGKRKQPRQLAYKGKTHKMPNGDIHTGATHTKSSKLVKKATRTTPPPPPKSTPPNKKKKAPPPPPRSLPPSLAGMTAKEYKAKVGKKLKDFNDRQKSIYSRLAMRESRARKK